MPGEWLLWRHVNVPSPLDSFPTRRGRIRDNAGRSDAFRRDEPRRQVAGISCKPDPCGGVERPPVACLRLSWRESALGQNDPADER